MTYRYQTRAEIKAKAPYVAEVVYMLFDDGDWNPCMGVRIDSPRDQTFNQTCATAPGSALCGMPLSKDFIGPPMEDLLKPVK